MWASPLIFFFLFPLTLFSSGGSLSSLISNVDKGIELNCKIKKKQGSLLSYWEKFSNPKNSFDINEWKRLTFFSWFTLGSSYYFVLEGRDIPSHLYSVGEDWSHLRSPWKLCDSTKKNPQPHSIPIKQWITAAPKPKDLHVSFNL